MGLRTGAAAACATAAAIVVAVLVFSDGGSESSPAPEGPAVDAALAGAPLRDCGSRAEGDRPPEMASRPGDVVVGPFAFAGLERVATRRGLERQRDGTGYGVKAGAALLAGTQATLVIARHARGWVSLAYATPAVREVSDGDPAVRFRACPADQPAFSNAGPVGITTGFAGGFILSRPGCVPLEVHVAGRRTMRASVPFGVGRCSAG